MDSSAAAPPDSDPDARAAVACAARSARRFLITSSAFSDSVASVTPRVETYRRALYVIERRTVHALLAAGHGARRDEVRLPPNPAALDPWSVDPQRIAAESRVVALCPTCVGATTVACVSCRGTARARCGECGGGGKVQGQRGLKNCDGCRGKGDVKCTVCRNGNVECATCAAVGRVFAWLAVEQRTSSRVVSHPDCAATSVHADVDKPADFDAGPAGWPNQLVDDSGVRAPSTRPDRELRPDLDKSRDRILSARTQTFSSTVYELDYATAFSAGKVEVAGQPPAVASSSDWAALSRRRALLIVVGTVGVLAAFRARAGYMGRHAWFAQSGHGGLVLWTVLVAGLLVTLVVAGLTLARSARARSRINVPAGLVGAAFVVALLAYFVGGPTRAAAERALMNGDLSQASAEAAAMIALEADRPGGEQIEDAIHTKSVEQSDSPGAMAIAIARPWHDDACRRAALDLLHTAADEAGSRLYSQHKTRELEELAGALDELDPPLAQRFHGLALLLRALDMAARADLATEKEILDKAASFPVPADELTRTRDTVMDAFRRHFLDLVTRGSAAVGDPRARRDALAAALTLSAQYAAIAGKPTDPTLEALQARSSLVTKEVEAAEKRAAALAALEEAKRKREEAIAEAKRAQEEAQQRAREAAADEGSDQGGVAYGGNSSNGGGSVQVRGYYRKNGTYVGPHSRSPRRR